MKYRHLLIPATLVFLALSTEAASLPNVPSAVGMYGSTTGAAGTWLPWITGAGTSIPYVPDAVGAYCSTDGTGNPGTWAPCTSPASWTIKGQPHATFAGASSTTFTGINTNYGGSYTPTLAITITGVDIHLDTAGAGCTTFAVVSVYDETAAAAVAGTAITLSTAADYHVTSSANIPAGHRLAFATTTAGVGCTTNPTGPHFNVEYVMQ